MAVWKCKNCGHETEARCKPKSCPQCSGKDTFTKKEAGQSK